MAEKRETSAQCTRIGDIAHADFRGKKTVLRAQLGFRGREQSVYMYAPWLDVPKEATAVGGDGEEREPSHHPKWAAGEELSPQEPGQTVLTRCLPRAFRPTGTFDGRKVPQVIGVGPVPLFASHCQCFLPPPQSSALRRVSEKFDRGNSQRRQGNPAQLATASLPSPIDRRASRTPARHRRKLSPPNSPPRFARSLASWLQQPQTQTRERLCPSFPSPPSHPIRCRFRARAHVNSSHPVASLGPPPSHINMAAPRKRTREVDEASRAECPFTIRLIDPKDRDQKKKRRRRNDDDSDDSRDNKIPVQMSPFAPSGKFKSFETMDIHYVVEPSKRWSEMTRYNSFVRMCFPGASYQEPRGGVHNILLICLSQSMVRNTSVTTTFLSLTRTPSSVRNLSPTKSNSAHGLRATMTGLLGFWRFARAMSTTSTLACTGCTGQMSCRTVLLMGRRLSRGVSPTMARMSSSRPTTVSLRIRAKEITIRS